MLSHDATHQVRYCLASDLDDKRVAAFEAALAQATDQIGPCVAFVDVGGSDGRCTRGARDDYWLLIVQAKEEGCFVRPDFMGPSRMNLGWCDSIAYAGNIMHELCAAFGKDRTCLHVWLFD